MSASSPSGDQLFTVEILYIGRVAASWGLAWPGREVDDLALKNPTDVKLYIGCHPGSGTVQGRTHPLPGFVRRVVVLQK